MAKSKTTEEKLEGLKRIFEKAKESLLNRSNNLIAANELKEKNKAANQKEIGKKAVSIEQNPEDFPPFIKNNLAIDQNSISEVKEEISQEEYANELNNFIGDELEIFDDIIKISKYKFKFVKSKTK